MLTLLNFVIKLLVVNPLTLRKFIENEHKKRSRREGTRRKDKENKFQIDRLFTQKYNEL